MAKVKKTNVMRILDKHKIVYDIKTYAYTEDDLSGIGPMSSLSTN